MDFQDHHHLDLGDDTYWDRRTWSWMRLRIIALLTVDTRLSQALRIQHA